MDVIVTGDNTAPIAVNDTASTIKKVPIIINLLTNDTDADGDALSVTSATNGSNRIVVLNGDSSVTYTPRPGFSGNDLFTYNISDGNGGSDTATVSVTIKKK